MIMLDYYKKSFLELPSPYNNEAKLYGISGQDPQFVEIGIADSGNHQVGIYDGLNLEWLFQAETNLGWWRCRESSNNHAFYITST